MHGREWELPCALQHKCAPRRITVQQRHEHAQCCKRNQCRTGRCIIDDSVAETPSIRRDRNDHGIWRSFHDRQLIKLQYAAACTRDSTTTIVPIAKKSSLFGQRLISPEAASHGQLAPNAAYAFICTRIIIRRLSRPAIANRPTSVTISGIPAPSRRTQR